MGMTFSIAVKSNTQMFVTGNLSWNVISASLGRLMLENTIALVFEDYNLLTIA
jgi:hypothetical protein